MRNRGTRTHGRLKHRQDGSAAAKSGAWTVGEHFQESRTDCRLNRPFSARFQGCLSFFVSVQILVRRLERRPRRVRGSPAQQCPADHLENVLRTQEGIDDAVVAGSKTPVASLAGHLYRESARRLVSI